MSSVSRLFARVSAIVAIGSVVAGCDPNNNKTTEYTPKDGQVIGQCLGKQLGTAVFDYTVRSVDTGPDNQIKDYSITAKIDPRLGSGMLRLEGTGFYPASGEMNLSIGGAIGYNQDRDRIMDRVAIRSSLARCSKPAKEAAKLGLGSEG